MGLKLFNTLILFAMGLSLTAALGDNYPGVIELEGFSNRKARTYYKPAIEERPTLAPSNSKIQADIETVKQNIEKYNKLLTLDTKNLPESQKDMLERIVERVARLKETLDIHEQLSSNLTTSSMRSSTEEDNSSNAAEGGEENSTFSSTDAITMQQQQQIEEEDKTEPTLVLDETTLLQLQTSMDKLAAAQAAVTSQTAQMRELPSTTEINYETEDDSDSADSETSTNLPESESQDSYELTTVESATETTEPEGQFVVARSNNAGITAASDDAETMATLSTTIGSQRTLTTSGKLTKTRATKRPNHPSTKGSGNAKRRPSTASSSSNMNTKTFTTKHKMSHSTAAVTPQVVASTQYQKITQKPLAIPPQPSLQTYQQTQQTPPKPVLNSLDKYTTTAAVSPSSAVTYGGINPVNNIATLTSSTSALPASSYGGGGAGLNHDLVYDGHVNASAIIDSLSNREEYYQQQQQKLAQQAQQTGIVNKDKKPISGAKPTKYHYYPHNQHIYLLPECAIQQVCNAVYVRLNYTQPLCACPSRYRDPCSASLNEDDQHTTKLVGDGKKKAITLAKTCEATTEMRECRSPKDWSLLALQNTRTGKSHYLVICRCPDHFKMEGPMAHDQPTYASVPGIRVFGMMCVKPGYSVRKPSAQPPKRYQLQKPFYRPGSQTSSFNQQSSSSLGGGGGGGGGLSSQYGINKENYARPSYGGGSSSSSSSSSSSGFNSATSNNYHNPDSYQPQNSYQYLNRPESISSSSFNNNNNNNNNYRPEPVSINNFPSASYGRNNEREGTDNIEAATDNIDNKLILSTSTQSTSDETRSTAVSQEETTKSAEDINEKQREKRSLGENSVDGGDVDDMPDFPWDRVIEFEKTVVWD